MKMESTKLIRRLRCWAFTAGLAVATSWLPWNSRAADDAETLEYKIKAGYLYNFAKYVEWPTNVFKDYSSPIVIGVLDGTVALPVIQRVLADKTVNDRPILLKAITTPSKADGCQILFVSRTAKISLEELRAALDSAATLIVGETDRFAENGGMIGLVREDDAFRPHLNLESVTAANLKVSAKLASVAKRVKTRSDK